MYSFKLMVGLEMLRSIPYHLQIYCVFLFLAAVSLFGTLISQLNEIVAAQTNQTKELENTLASYLAIIPRCFSGSLNLGVVL
jgi:hypothetical protein